MASIMGEGLIMGSLMLVVGVGEGAGGMVVVQSRVSFRSVMCEILERLVLDKRVHETPGET